MFEAKKKNQQAAEKDQYGNWLWIYKKGFVFPRPAIFFLYICAVRRPISANTRVQKGSFALNFGLNKFFHFLVRANRRDNSGFCSNSKKRSANIFVQETVSIPDLGVLLRSLACKFINQSQKKKEKKNRLADPAPETRAEGLMQDERLEDIR